MATTKKATKRAVLAELERFGYSLRVLAETEEGGRSALRKEYIRTYKHINNCNPTKDELKVAMDEINFTDAMFGEVWWD